jgi:N-acetylmuramoyl-L-alanine amidase CwlA
VKAQNALLLQAATAVSLSRLAGGKTMDRKSLEALLNLKNGIIPQGRPNRSGRQISATHITIHNTSNPNKGADAEAHSRFVREKGFYVLKSGKINYVSWHFTVDDNRVIKHLPLNERGIHAGGGNGVSIGIEVCMNKGIDQEAADVRAARLVAGLMFDLGIERANIKPHKFWTNKDCPTLLLPKFNTFCEMAEKISKEIKSSQELPDQSAAQELSPATEIAAIQTTRKAIEQGLEGPTLPDEDDPDEAHGLVSEEVNKFAN